MQMQKTQCWQLPIRKREAAARLDVSNAGSRDCRAGLKSYFRNAPDMPKNWPVRPVVSSDVW